MFVLTIKLNKTLHWRQGKLLLRPEQSRHELLIKRVIRSTVAANKYNMSMKTYGKIEEYNGEKEEWQYYMERMDHFFAANGIEDATKKLSIFLVSVGAKT